MQLKKDVKRCAPVLFLLETFNRFDLKSKPNVLELAFTSEERAWQTSVAFA
jgi:hypothetical protein